MACCQSAGSLYRKMHRKRRVNPDAMETPLKRCLSVVELSFIGLSLMASGIFIVTGTVVSTLAGPGIVLSYILAGIAAVMSAFAYAEMGSRVPRAGSSYVYASVGLGEVWGFLAGWNMVLEYVLQCAAMSRSFTSILTVLLGGQNVSKVLNKASFVLFGQRTDLIAACVVIFFSVIVGLGVRLASIINVSFNVTAMLMVLGVSIACFFYGDVSHWNADGVDTFFPYGFGGVLSGAAVCYFSYIGFEAVTVSGEESTNPKKALPRAILLAFLMAITCYVGSSLAFTFFAPKIEFSPNLALPVLFMRHGLLALSIVIGIAGLLSVCTNILVTLYTIPRILYAMAGDGLLFSWLSSVNPRTQTPLHAMVASCIFVALVTFFIGTEVLVEAVSVGTLSSYILVALGVILLRFEPSTHVVSHPPLDANPDLVTPPPYYAEDVVQLQDAKNEADVTQSLDKSTSARVIEYQSRVGLRKQWVQNNAFFNMVWPDIPPGPTVVAMGLSMAFLAFFEALAIRLQFFFTVWNAIMGPIFLVPVIFFVIHLSLYEQNLPDPSTYRIPWMPLLPAISVYMNLQFMMMLSYVTWIRLVVWVAVGALIYFGYGIRHSVNKEPDELLTASVHASYGTHSDTTIQEKQDES